MKNLKTYRIETGACIKRGFGETTEQAIKQANIQPGYIIGITEIKGKRRKNLN